MNWLVQAPAQFDRAVSKVLMWCKMAIICLEQERDPKDQTHLQAVQQLGKRQPERRGKNVTWLFPR